MISGESNRKNWLIPALVLAAMLIVLRIPALLHPVLDADEAIFGLISRLWFDGGVPYVSFAETKPVGIYLFYGAVFSIFGKFNMTAVHAVTIAVVGLTAYFIGRIASIVYSSRGAAFWTALFYIVFGTTYIPKYIATNIEPIMLLPIVLQFYFWLRFEREDNSWFAYASGLAFSAACLFKYQAGINLVVFVLYLAAKTRFKIPSPLVGEGQGEGEKGHGFHPPLNPLPSREGKIVFRGFLRFLIASIPLPLLMIAYLAYSGGLEGFWFWNVRGNAEYIKGGSESIGFFYQVLTRIIPYVASTILVWFLATLRIKNFWVLAYESRVTSHESRKTLEELLIIIWLVLNFIPVCMGRRFYGHYFLLLLPPLAILAAKVADDLWKTHARRFAKAMIIFWLILPAFGFTAARFFISDIHSAVGEDNLDDYKPIAAYISEHTSGNDRISVWGFAPLVYWDSQRLPGTRFIHTDILAGRISGAKGCALKDKDRYAVPETWEMFFSDLEKNKPLYFVDTSPAALHDYENYPIEFYPQLVEYLGRHYSEEARVNGAVFYRRIR